MASNKIKKCQNLFPDFVIEAEAMSLVDLDNRLLVYAKYLEETKDKEAEDMENVSDPSSLGYAVAMAKERKAPYSETKKALALKMGYLIHLLKEKGGNV